MRFNDIGTRIEVKAPNLFEKHPARNKPTVAAQQDFELVKFPLYRAFDEVNFKVARSEPGGRATEGRTPRQRIEARQQLLEGERFDEIIVAARATAIDTVVNSGHIRKEQDRVATPSARSRAMTDSPSSPGSIR
jgi:hypothetical protein